MSLTLHAAVRRWRRNPLFTASIVGILALGIGVVGHTFGSLDAMVLRPLPFGDPNRIVSLWESQPRLGKTWALVSPPDFDDWRRNNRGLAGMAAYEPRPFSIGGDDRPEHVPGARVTAGFIHVLGGAPLLGRGFEEGEDIAGAPPVAVISYVLWQRRFQADPHIVGRHLRIDGTPHTIVGVMPRRYEFPEWTEIWTPLALDVRHTPRDARWLGVVARLRPGWSLDDARTDLQAVASQLAGRYPQTNRDWSVCVRPLRDEMLPPAARAGLVGLAVSVLLVLLLVCANVANLLLADAIGRRQEMGIRAALGASRGLLIRETLVETVALAGLGGLLGLLVAAWLDDAIVAIVPFQVPRWIDLSMDVRSVVAIAITALLTGLAFGLAPALRGSTVNAVSVQRGESESQRRSGGAWLRHALLGFQVTASIVLLVGALLLVRSAVVSRGATLGLDTAHCLTLRLSLPAARYPDVLQRLAVIDRLLARCQSIPGIEQAAAADRLPASSVGFASLLLEAEGQPRTGSTGVLASRMAGTRDFPAVLGLSLVAGRWLRQEEIERGDAQALVSRTLAHRLWPGAEAVGRRMRPAGSTSADDWLTVAGIVSDVARPYQLKGIDAWPDAQVYVPMARIAAASQSPVLAVRTTGDPQAVAAALRTALQREVPDAPIFDLMTLEAVLQRLVWLPVLWGQWFSAFAALALAIAALGIYGFAAYSVRTRYREFGIRVALGASPRSLLRVALTRLLTTGTCALLVGLMLARAMATALSAMLDDVDPSDPIVYVAVGTLVAGVLVAGGWLPARRAATANALSLLGT